MLVDILAGVIGFAFVMLLLSLFVTSLVQLTQHLLRFCVRNFETGIEGLLDRAKKAGDNYHPSEVARKVVEVASLPVSKSRGLFGRALSWLGRGECTWLKVDEFTAVLRRLDIEIPVDRIAEVEAAFPLAERQMSASLVTLTRYAAVIWSPVVACYFQPSTPALLQRLSRDAR